MGQNGNNSWVAHERRPSAREAVRCCGAVQRGPAETKHVTKKKLHAYRDTPEHDVADRQLAGLLPARSSEDDCLRRKRNGLVVDLLANWVESGTLTGREQ